METEQSPDRKRLRRTGPDEDDISMLDSAAAPENNPLKFLLQRERYEPIFRALTTYLGVAEIVYLSRTCKQLSTLYAELRPRLWDVDRSLRRFVDDPKSLRSEMARSEALISGSFALQFFERVQWEASDLDIFVGTNKADGSYTNSNGLRRLLETEGYSLQQDRGLNNGYSQEELISVCFNLPSATEPF